MQVGFCAFVVVCPFWRGHLVNIRGRLVDNNFLLLFLKGNWAYQTIIFFYYLIKTDAGMYNDGDKKRGNAQRWHSLFYDYDRNKLRLFHDNLLTVLDNDALSGGSHLHTHEVIGGVVATVFIVDGGDAKVNL